MRKYSSKFTVILVNSSKSQGTRLSLFLQNGAVSCITIATGSPTLPSMPFKPSCQISKWRRFELAHRNEASGLQLLLLMEVMYGCIYGLGSVVGPTWSLRPWSNSHSPPFQADPACKMNYHAKLSYNSRNYSLEITMRGWLARLSSAAVDFWSKPRGIFDFDRSTFVEWQFNFNSRDL